MNKVKRRKEGQFVSLQLFGQVYVEAWYREGLGVVVLSAVAELKGLPGNKAICSAATNFVENLLKGHDPCRVFEVASFDLDRGDYESMWRVLCSKNADCATAFSTYFLREFGLTGGVL